MYRPFLLRLLAFWASGKSESNMSCTLGKGRSTILSVAYLITIHNSRQIYHRRILKVYKPHSPIFAVWFIYTTWSTCINLCTNKRWESYGKVAQGSFCSFANIENYGKLTNTSLAFTCPLWYHSGDPPGYALKNSASQAPWFLYVFMTKFAWNIMES